MSDDLLPDATSRISRAITSPSATSTARNATAQTATAASAAANAAASQGKSALAGVGSALGITAATAAATAGIGIAALGINGAIRAARHVPTEAIGTQREANPEVTNLAAADLAALIQCATVSAPNLRDPATFTALHAVIAQRFPLLTATLEAMHLGQAGVMYRWAGAGSAGVVENQIPDERPLILLAHLDVVPAQDAELWTHPPFAAVNDGERIHGRGALDNKGALTALLRGVELLLEQGFTPQRDVWLCLGDTEETAGQTAELMAAELERRGVEPFLILDEGGAVVEPGALLGVPHWAAMIGVAEKGILDVRLTSNAPGGHASTPAKNGATARIARAITRIEKYQFPSAIPEPTRQMMSELGRYASGALKFVYANVDVLAGPLAKALQLAGPETAAMTRTTAAVTQLSGSAASNVIAESASATVNLRLAIGSTSEDAVAHLRRAVDDDLIEIDIMSVTEPSAVSPMDGQAWELLGASVRAAFPDAIPAPYVQTGATDSRRFTGLSACVYRFAPLRMTKADREHLHAANESVLVETLAEGVHFIVDLIERVDGR